MRSPSKTICFCRIWGDFIIVIHGVTFDSQSLQTRMITDFFLVLSVPGSDILVHLGDPAL